jgi:hypothetical protein
MGASTIWLTSTALANKYNNLGAKEYRWAGPTPGQALTSMSSNAK